MKEYQFWSEEDLEDLDAKFDALAEFMGVEFVFERVSDGSDVADRSRCYARPKQATDEDLDSCLTALPEVLETKPVTTPVPEVKPEPDYGEDRPDSASYEEPIYDKKKKHGKKYTDY